MLLRILYCTILLRIRVCCGWRGDGGWPSIKSELHEGLLLALSWPAASIGSGPAAPNATSSLSSGRAARTYYASYLSVAAVAHYRTGSSSSHVGFTNSRLILFLATAVPSLHRSAAEENFAMDGDSLDDYPWCSQPSMMS
ncbi:hypothetical protein BDA96_01G180200 [Sorghum bicolor]|uniref:Secreted protein n=1 Tax=Sorghum bicolor TaxID=4558 RepID=A0A921RZ70_SORBI|nr:hypothetical protein BDA96_01G180200 [Sorghum bicolor]